MTNILRCAAPPCLPGPGPGPAAGVAFGLPAAGGRRRPRDGPVVGRRAGLHAAAFCRGRSGRRQPVAAAAAGACRWRGERGRGGQRVQLALCLMPSRAAKSAKPAGWPKAGQKRMRVVTDRCASSRLAVSLVDLPGLPSTWCWPCRRCLARTGLRWWAPCGSWAARPVPSPAAWPRTRLPAVCPLHQQPSMEHGFSWQRPFA